MEIYFATLFEDFRDKRSLIFLLSKTDPGMIEERDHEISILNYPALEKVHEQKWMKKSVAV